MPLSQQQTRMKLLYYEKQSSAEQEEALKWVAQHCYLNFDHPRYVQSSEDAEEEKVVPSVLDEEAMYDRIGSLLRIEFLGKALLPIFKFQKLW
jgi:hypothetical protein